MTPRSAMEPSRILGQNSAGLRQDSFYSPIFKFMKESARIDGQFLKKKKVINEAKGNGKIIWKTINQLTKTDYRPER